MRLDRSILLSVLIAAGLSSPDVRAQTRAPAHHADAAAGERTIAGTVISESTGQPLTDAVVSLADSRGGPLRMNTRTDAEGHFRFDHLYDGKFAIQASHRGFISAGYKEHEGYFTGIVTGEGMTTTDLTLSLGAQAIISGTVTDEAGDPVPQAQLTLYRQDDSIGKNRIVTVSAAATDDLGTFELSGFRPGIFFIAVSATPWYATHRQLPPGIPARGRSPLDVAFATTFYCDVTDPDTATPLAVKAGERVPINITMHAEPAVHLTFQLGELKPNQPPPMPELMVKQFGETEMVQAPVSYTQQEGGGQVAELSVAPGHYELRMISGRQSSSMAIVDAANGMQDFGVPRLETMPNIDGMVAVAGGGPLPSALQVRLAQEATQFIAPGSYSRVDTDGSFHLRGVAEGTYEIAIASPQLAVGVVSVAANGATSSGNTIKIGNGSATVAALIDVGRTNVNGFAKKDGQPFAGAMMVLIPADANSHPDAYRRDQTDSDGSFTLRQVLPGRYTLLAVEDGWSLEWARPAVMERYIAHGLKVTVSPDQKKLDLPESVEVQPR